MWERFKEGVCGACRMVKNGTVTAYHNTVENLPDECSRSVNEFKRDGKKFIDDPLCEKTEENQHQSGEKNQYEEQPTQEKNPFDEQP